MLFLVLLRPQKLCCHLLLCLQLLVQLFICILLPLTLIFPLLLYYLFIFTLLILVLVYHHLYPLFATTTCGCILAILSWPLAQEYLDQLQ